jgi:hypothetical protein
MAFPAENISSNRALRGSNLHRHNIDDQGNDLALAEMLSIGKLYKPELG